MNYNEYWAKKEFLTDIINMAPAAIFWKDHNGRFLGCNQFFAEVANLNSPEDIIGKTDFDLPWGEKQAKLYRQDDIDIMSTGKPKLNIEETILLANKRELYLLTNKTPLFDSNKNVMGILGVFYDITDRKILEFTLQKAKEEAEAANHAKTEFIANMSHDIRTPLAGIIGLSSILEEEINEKEQKETAHMLNISGAQLLSLLNSVLDIVACDNTREKRANLSEFNLEELLYNIFELELPALQLKAITFKLYMDAATPRIIKSDKGKIYRILLNLISNAIKFTSEGSITLSIKVLKKKGANTLLQFQIKDTGIGIDEKDQKRIFETFFRGTPSYEGKFDGHGVGLAIVKQYIEALSGDISVNSRPNHGTTISVSIPVSALSQETIPANNLEKKLHQYNAWKNSETSIHISESHENCKNKIPFVLLVEDNPMAMRVASIVLNKSNCHYLQAFNGTQALELIKKNRFDGIITDIGLPDFSGFVLAKKIVDYQKAQNLPLTPIIGLTAHGKEEALKYSEKSGMKTMFEKPLKSEDVQILIQQCFFIDKISQKSG